MTPVVLWGWIIMGLGGCVRLIIRLVEAETPITRHWLDELKKETETLIDCCERASKRIENE